MSGSPLPRNAPGRASTSRCGRWRTPNHALRHARTRPRVPPSMGQGAQHRQPRPGRRRSRARYRRAQRRPSKIRSTIAHFAKAQVLRAQHRYAEAIPEYETVIALNRNWAHSYSHLGWCKFMTGSIEQLIPTQEQAIRLSPRDPQIGLFYSRIGSAHLLQSRAKEAIFWYEKARNATPAHPQFRTFLAAAYALKGDIEMARAELAEARRLVGDARYSSVARVRAITSWGEPTVRALAERTYFAGLRDAGLPN